MDQKIYSMLCDKLNTHDYESFEVLLSKYEATSP